MNNSNKLSSEFSTFRFPKIDSNPILRYCSLPIPQALDSSRIVSYIYHPIEPNQRLLIINDPTYLKTINNEAFLYKNGPLTEEILEEWDYDIDSFMYFYNNLSIVSLKKALWINKTLHKKLFYNNFNKPDKLFQQRFQHIHSHRQKRSEIRNQFQKNRFLIDYAI